MTIVRRDTVSGENQEWMAYIDSEVRAVCEAKGWRHQIRRKWSVREKPVAESSIEDYEWKLIPSVEGTPTDAPLSDFEGTYYVLRFDKPMCKFVFQHDTLHFGRSSREVETYTEIHIIPEEMISSTNDAYKAFLHRTPGWLRDHLFDLTTRFRPNTFSLT